MIFFCFEKCKIPSTPSCTSHLPMAVLIHFVPNSLDLVDYVDNPLLAISNWMVEIFGLSMWDINGHSELYLMVETVAWHLSTPNDKRLPKRNRISMWNYSRGQESVFVLVVLHDRRSKIKRVCCVLTITN